MGISIHYHGQLDTIEALPKLLDELTDIAQSMRWDCQRIQPDAGNREFTGVVISPGDDCESLTFLFDHAGRLRNLADGMEALEHLPEDLDQMVAEIERIVSGENEP